MLGTILIVGFIGLLVLGGAIWAIREGAPFIGFIMLCLVIGAIALFCFGGCNV